MSQAPPRVVVLPAVCICETHTHTHTHTHASNHVNHPTSGTPRGTRTSYARYASPKKARNVCSSTKVLASISGMDQEQSLDWVRAILKQFLSRTLSPPPYARPSVSAHGSTYFGCGAQRNASVEQQSPPLLLGCQEKSVCPEPTRKSLHRMGAAPMRIRLL